MIKEMYQVMQRIHDIRSRFGLNRKPLSNAGSSTTKDYQQVLMQTMGGERKAAGTEGDISGVRGKTVDEINKIAGYWADKNNISPGLVRAVIDVESGYNPDAVSPKGARGLMQLMPSVMQDFGVSDPLNPQENIRAGVGLLSSLLQEYKGDYRMALSAYNAGRETVRREGGVPDYPETKEFIQKVMASYLKNSE